MRPTAPFGRPTGEAADMASEQDPVGVLYLDVEGGWGGSSRSMYYLIEALDRTRWRPVAVLRKAGPSLGRYQALGVPHLHLLELPSFRPGDRNNWFAAFVFLWSLRRLPTVYRRVGRLIREHHVRLIHVNHESLALTGLLIARRFRLPWVCHIRTLLSESIYARLVLRVINRFADHVVFVAEPNEAHYASLVGRSFQKEKGTVCYNVVPDFPDGIQPLPELLEPADALRVVCLSNFSHNRGVDRLVDVADELRRRGREDFVFFLCGMLAHKRLLPGAKNLYFEDIKKRVGELGLEHMIRFPGHVEDPERALAACHVLVRPSRYRPAPWGRDIMEAMMLGRPVIALGTYQGFVEDGVNGFLDPEYSPHRFADHLIELCDNEALRGRMAQASRAKARRLFNGAEAARRVAGIYGRVLGPECGR